ncbi:MAG: N-acetylmuramoyl-L-alanine amidase [Ruminococcaceae bacterium]|nr:N-acetylmuramoyl-L-alanine amidase [Oscillospiraceae bacterium]
MNSHHPPQQPPRPPQRRPLTREEWMRYQEYLRKKKQKELHRKLAILICAALLIITTVILISVALHRSSHDDASLPADSTPAATTDPKLPESTAAPQTTPAETTVPPSAPKKFTVCIDPGHGYDDPGASTEYLGTYTESDVTLAIGLKLRDKLLARGYDVIMTHETNTPPADAPAGEQYLFGLAKRTAYANENEPDFYLSIHGDTFEDPSVQGARVYFQSITGKDNSSITAVAQCFVDALTVALTDAVKTPLLKEMADENAYYVLRNVDMPAVLVEVGFASNPTDAANMLNEAWQDRVAEALANGVDRAYGH